MKRKKVMAILDVLAAFVLLASLCGEGPAQAPEGKAGKEPKGIFSYAPSRYHVLPEGDRPAIGVDAERTAKTTERRR
jgi:hypothetical protein